MRSFIGWLKNDLLTESDTRYSVEINYRTKTNEVLKHAAKITLGYASAALKKQNFHVKQVFEQEPYRIMVSSRNWDDGEWVCIVSWHPEHQCYYISKGFYNKDRKSVSIPSKPEHVQKCEADNASEIVNKVKNIMHSLKDKPDRHIEKLKKVPLKRGPK
jgi:hypothetical protein